MRDLNLRLWSRRALLLAALVLASAAAQAQGTAKTPLDDYVAKPDPSYSWKLDHVIEGQGYKAYVIDLTSQTWRTEKEVDQPVWKHWLTIVKPDGATYNKAIIYIDGGGSGEKPPTKIDPIVSALAMGTKSVACELRQIPNQPLKFVITDQKPRKEDDLIAYTWIKAMETGDPTWSARMPMVKAGVRAMDTVQTFLKSKDGGEMNIDKFVIVGGSKRGWTTWLVGAVDKRVCAIIPAVIDVLNMQKTMQHHLEAYGFWARAVGDYVEHDVVSKAGTKAYTDLLSYEDPYSYRDRLTMPKFIVNASGDQFFLPDNSQFYFDDLKGEKYLRYTPNADHGLGGSDAAQAIGAFYKAILDDKPRPQFSWKFEGDDTIKVTAKDKPKAVTLWQANNPEARDFRVESIGRAYKSSPLEDQGGGVYTAKVGKPEKGWTAYYVELTFESGAPLFPFKFTTAVRVTPEVLPFAGLSPQKGKAEGPPKPKPAPPAAAGK